MVLFLIFISLFVCYSILILYYWQSWISIPDPLLPADGQVATGFTSSNQSLSISISIIIPARNEEENIGELLKALQEQTYPKELFEIIVVDDHSTDKTAGIVSMFPGVKLISLKEEAINSYKKKLSAFFSCLGK